MKRAVVILAAICLAGCGTLVSPIKQRTSVHPLPPPALGATDTYVPPEK